MRGHRETTSFNRGISWGSWPDREAPMCGFPMQADERERGMRYVLPVSPFSIA